MSACQLFYPDSDGYSETSSVVTSVRSNNWTTVQFDIPFPAGPLRLDPANRRATIEIADLVVESRSTSSILWRLGPDQMNEINCAGTAIRLPDEDRLLVVSYGNDPQLYLPVLSALDIETDLRLHFRVRIDPYFSDIAEFCQRYSKALAEVASLREEIERVRESIAGLAVPQSDAAQQVPAVQAQSELASDSPREQYSAALSEVAAMRKSLSWRITAPLRRVASFFLSEEPKK